MAKVSILLLMILLTSLVLGACNKSQGNTQTGSSVVDSTFKELVLEVPTITCPSCQARVEASAKRVSGVMEVKFDRKSIRKATIIYDPAQTSPEAIVKAIERNGDKAIQRPQ